MLFQLFHEAGVGRYGCKYELIPAVAGKETVVLIAYGLQDMGGFFQSRIAFDMAIGIIDAFEGIDIQQHEPEHSILGVLVHLFIEISIAHIVYFETQCEQIFR